jgi:porin
VSISVNIRRNSKVSLLSPAIVLAGLILCPDLALAETAEPVGPGISDPVTADVVLEASDDVLLGPEPIPLEGLSMEASDLAPPAAIPTSLESAPEADLAQTTAPAPAPAAQPGLAERSRLTGDWGGTRTQWEEAGITLNLEFTNFYQGLVSGTGPQTFEYGGRLDGFVDLDTEKLGLWDGGGLHAHLEYRFGALAGSLGNTFFPTNAAMEFPSESPDTLVATSLYLSQRFGDQASLLIGKINVLDLLENDLFFGGWGIHRFMNAVYAAPPSGLVPPVMFGAIANVRLDPVTLSFWIYDPDDQTQDYWPDDLFANGVSFNFTTSYATEIAGRPTTFSINGIYTTKTGTDFSSVSESFRSGLEPLTATGSYSIGFQASHLLYQLPNNPRQGWGLFLKGAISDGNPNYVQNSITVGVGGLGLFAGRELDSFGLGYYYFNLSDALQDSLNEVGTPIRFGDEQGFEMYYSYAVTPWFYLTGDLQYISPPRSSVEDAFIVALRANIRF